MASIEYVVNATDAASRVFEKIGLSADDLGHQLDELGKRVADPEVRLDDAKFTLGMVKAAERLDKLSAKIADPKVEIDTAKAQVEILRINAMLDRLGAKKVDVTVDVNRSLRSRLGGAFFGLGGGTGGDGGFISQLKNILGGSAAGGAQGGGIFAGQLGPVGIGAAIAAAMAFGPAGIPLGLGALVGGGAAGGGLILGSAANKQLQALGKSLASAKGPQRAAILSQMQALRQQNAGPLALFGAFQDVGTTAKTTFSQALEAPGAGNVLTGAAGPSFLTGLEGILKQVAGFVKAIGPQLGDMFRASLPFLSMFAKILEQSAKILLPAFTQSLKQLAPFIPQLTKAFVVLVQGLADFIKNLGPGMKDSVTVFLGAAELIKGILIVLAKGADYTAKFFANFGHVSVDVARAAVKAWDWLRQQSVILWHQIVDDASKAWHAIVAAASSAWAILLKGVKDAIGTILHLFGGLPSQAIHAMAGLGRSLASFMRAAWDDMWSAAKSVAGDIWNWLTGWVHDLPGFLRKILGISSPSSVFFDIGHMMMLGLEKGIKHGAGTALNAAKRTVDALANQGTAGGGPVSADAAGAMRYAQSQFGRYGWSMGLWPALRDLWTRESGWSRFAYNASSGATGIPQALPYTKMPRAAWLPSQGGSASAGAQVNWGLSYIAQRYGNPGAAWAHEMQFGWYDRGGWLPPGLSLALNQTGKPERVGGTGTTYNINIAVPVAANKAEVGRQVVEAIREFEKRSGPGWRR